MKSFLHFLLILAFCSIASFVSAAGFDDCINAEVLTPENAGVNSCAAPVIYDAAGSTQSRSYAGCDNNFTSTCRDVWFTFTAAATSHIIIVDGSSSYTAVVEGFSGNCTSLATIGCAYTASQGAIVTLQLTGLTPGNTYYFRVYHRAATIPTTTTFTVCLLTPPSNDECIGSINLTPNAPGDTACLSPPSVDANLASQSKSYASCDNNFTSIARDVWFNFKASATSHTLVVDGSSSYTAVVEAYRGNCNGLNSIGCAYASSAGGIATLQLTGLKPDSTYYFRVYHRNSAIPSSTTFTICLFTAVANDECENAITLSPNAPQDSCTIKGTYYTDFSSQTKSYASCDNNFTSVARDVWFKFTATATSHTVIVDGSSSYIAVIEVFSGTCSSMTSIGCASASSVGAVVTLSLSGLTIGNQYYIRVYHRSSSIPSTTSFSVCLQTAPLNDECSGAYVLTPNNTGVNVCAQQLNGDANLASQSKTYASCDNNFTSTVRDVWYKFTAAATSHTISVDGSSSYIPVVEAYSGSCASLTSIGCSASATAGGKATWQLTGLTVNGVYYVRVYHRASGIPSTTGFTICLLTAPANDESCNSKVLTPGLNCIYDTADAVLSSQSKSYASCDNNFTSTVRDIWFQFTASDASQSINVDGSSSYIAVVEVYSGTCSSLTSVGCKVASSAGALVTLNLTGLTTGNTYFVRVYHRNSSVPSTTTFGICITGSVTTGTDEMSDSNGLKVYPNPAGNQITVSYWQSSGKAEIELHDILGQMVLKSEIINRTSEIDISALPGGLYILTVKGLNDSRRVFLVKE